MSTSHYDVIIIGAGHNGLVAAAYLAGAGRRVLVLERRELVGGACVTEELWPGFKVSTGAYLNSLFRPEIVRDLDLPRHGFRMLRRDPSSFTPLPDGRSLMLGPDPAFNQEQVSRFSARDAAALPRYEAMLDRLVRFVEPLLLRPPPDPWSGRLADLWELALQGWRFTRLGDDGPRLLEFMTGPATPILDRWFESEPLKAMLATDAVIGAMAAPSMPGTAYVLFHHVMGEGSGARGEWGCVEGGMGGLTRALAAAARERGAAIRCEAPVARILVRDGSAVGVVLEDGTEYHAPRVASNADAHVTFLKLVEPGHLPAAFVAAVRGIDYASPVMKINVALDALPDFHSLPGTAPGPQHRGTIHLCPTVETLERAYDDAKYGRPSRVPMVECTLPSVLDPTIAPPGKHVMTMFVQYAPTTLREGHWDQEKDAFADRCFALVDEYAPNFSRSVLERQVLSPLDLERRFGLTGGNIFQGAMTPQQLFFLRPLPRWARYRTPLRGLYLCGAATHPGGGVTGACGYNAAREILRDQFA